VAIGPVTVEAAANPLVPRDRSHRRPLLRAAVRRLPVQDVRDVLRLEPAWSRAAKRRPLDPRRPAGEAAVYVDGALVRNSQRGESDLTLGTNAVEEASVTTGRSVRIRRRAVGHPRVRHARGSRSTTGSLSYASDDMGTLWRNVGFNRIEASVSGPIKGNLTFSVRQAHRAEVGRHGEGPRPGPPIFVADGVDTVLTHPRRGAPIQRTPSRSRSALRPVQRLLRQLRSRRRAGERRHAAQAIRSNFGVECQGCGCRSRRAGSTPATPSCNTPTERVAGRAVW